jgi:hypothetical protein
MRFYHSLRKVIKHKKLANISSLVDTNNFVRVDLNMRSFGNLKDVASARPMESLGNELINIANAF